MIYINYCFYFYHHRSQTRHRNNTNNEYQFLFYSCSQDHFLYINRFIHSPLGDIIHTYKNTTTRSLPKNKYFIKMMMRQKYFI